MRLSIHNRTLVAFCNLTDVNHQASDPLDDVRTPITIQHGVDCYVYQNTLSADISASDAKAGVSKQLGAVSIGPLRESTGYRDQYTRYVVLEGNHINASLSFQTGVSDVVIRNNILDRADSNGVSFTQLTGSDPSGQPYYIPVARIYIWNNTLRNNSSSGTLFKIQDALDGLEIINTHCLGASLSTNPNFALCCDFRSGFGSNNKIQRNVWPVADNFRINSVVENTATFNLRSQAVGTNIKEATTVDINLKPASNSKAATHARPYQGVFDDVKNTTRAAKAATWTAGAYQV